MNAAAGKLSAWLSVHDVMPESLDRVDAIVQRLEGAGHQHVTLLIVPGKDWSRSDLAKLRAWDARGHRLAGHGWHHVARSERTLYHKLHALVLSRDAAEHLSQSRDALLDLLARNYSWFAQHDLPSPNLYVPPAWAAGRVGYRDVAAAGFDWLETLTGLRHCVSGDFQSLPLVGFEADTVARARGLRRFNAVMEKLASPRRPLRVSIHPYDFDYHLAQDLSALIERVEHRCIQVV